MRKRMGMLAAVILFWLTACGQGDADASQTGIHSGIEEGIGNGTAEVPADDTEKETAGGANQSIIQEDALQSAENALRDEEGAAASEANLTGNSEDDFIYINQNSQCVSGRFNPPEYVFSEGSLKRPAYGQ